MVIIFHICLHCAIKRLKGHVRREIVGRYENMLKYAELQKCKQANFECGYSNKNSLNVFPLSQISSTIKILEEYGFCVIGIPNL